MATVSLRRLRKLYGDIEAVRGIDLEIADQEFVVLVGPSGCGKSTTLRMIAGTMPLGLSTFLAYFEDTTGALYAFCVMVLVPGLLIFLLAQNQFIQGLTSGARKG